MNDEFWRDLLIWTEYILYIIFLLSVSYLFIFALFSLKRKPCNFKKTRKQYRYLIALTTNHIDDSVYKTVDSFVGQHYTKENFDIAVITKKATNAAESTLKNKPVSLLKCQNGEEFRGQMLETLALKMGSDYDIIVVMKPGDVVEPNFLEEINKAYHSGGMAIQTHRMLKNPRTNTAILNAVSEEINNSIFRRGHVNLGFSAGLIGSGMAFNYDWFKKNISKVKQRGLTKQLETTLLRQGIFIEYLDYLPTYDEKNRTESDFQEERQHWYSSKLYSLTNALRDFPVALVAGNFDFCDKIIQWILPSRFIMLFVIVAMSIGLLFIDGLLSIKWFILLFVIFLVFDLAIPPRFQKARTIFALFSLPLLFLSTFINLFRSGKE